jgi:hypothetical protein
MLYAGKGIRDAMTTIPASTMSTVTKNLAGVPEPPEIPGPARRPRRMRP